MTLGRIVLAPPERRELKCRARKRSLAAELAKRAEVILRLAATTKPPHPSAGDLRMLLIALNQPLNEPLTQCTSGSDRTCGQCLLTNDTVGPFRPLAGG